MKGIPQHKEFKITNSYNIDKGHTPSYSELKEEHAIPLEKAKELVQHFLDDTKLDFKCVYNGCQNRAMVMSLILKTKNIQHCKIWNFDPGKIALYNEQNKLNLDDPLRLMNEIYWDYHVAIAILVKNDKNGKAEKYVIDPSFINSPLKLLEWLSKPSSPNSYYTFLDPEWYECVELKNNSSIVCNEQEAQIIIPDCFPKLYTGDFYKYSAEKNASIADELAADKQITDFTHEVIHKLKDGNDEKTELIDFVTDYKNKIDPVLKGEKEVKKSHPFFKYKNRYKKAYQELYEYWLNKLNDLADRE